MRSRIVQPLNEMMGVDADGVPVTFSDICDSPVDGWSRINVFSHQGALCYFTARLYNRRIPEHIFFKARDTAVIDKSVPFQEVGQCH